MTRYRYRWRKNQPQPWNRLGRPLPNNNLRHSQRTLTPPKGRGFQQWNKDNLTAHILGFNKYHRFSLWIIMFFPKNSWITYSPLGLCAKSAQAKGTFWTVHIREEHKNPQDKPVVFSVIHVMIRLKKSLLYELLLRAVFSLQPVEYKYIKSKTWNPKCELKLSSFVMY